MNIDVYKKKIKKSLSINGWIYKCVYIYIYIYILYRYILIT